MTKSKFWFMKPVILSYLAIVWLPCMSTSSKYSSACISDSDCETTRTFLRCAGQTCKCPAVNHFDVEINRCLIRVGGTCEVRSKTQYCVSYAECKANSGKSSTVGTCQCRNRYKETIDSLCTSSSTDTHKHFGSIVILILLFVLTLYYYL